MKDDGEEGKESQGKDNEKKYELGRRNTKRWGMMRQTITNEFQESADPSPKRLAEEKGEYIQRNDTGFHTGTEEMRDMLRKISVNLYCYKCSIRQVQQLLSLNFRMFNSA